MPKWQMLKAAGGSERRGSREEEPNAYQTPVGCWVRPRVQAVCMCRAPAS